MPDIMNALSRMATLVGAALLTTIVAACGDDPTMPAHDHFEARGLLLSDGATELVTYDSGRTTDTIRLQSGSTLAPIRMEFILENGTRGTPSDPDLHCVWEIADTSKAAINWFEREGVYTLRLSGLREGETSVVFKLLHVDHEDFVTRPIPIQIAP